jgi:hypothetical protein
VVDFVVDFVVDRRRPRVDLGVVFRVVARVDAQVDLRNERDDRRVAPANDLSSTTVTDFLISATTFRRLSQRSLLKKSTNISITSNTTSNRRQLVGINKSHYASVAGAAPCGAVRPSEN